MRGIGFMLLMVVVPSISVADEFRLENKVFREGQKEAIVSTLTLFPAGDVVYDFAFAPGDEEIERATVYDFNRGRFVLVDYKAGVKMEIEEEEVLKILSELTAKLESAAPLLKEAASPSFEVTEEEGVIKFKGKALSYEVHTASSVSKTAPRDYQRFADWTARLNTLQPHGMPPMARIKVNETLSEKGLLPKEVILTRADGPIWENAKKLRSVHTLQKQLTRSDRIRIESLSTKMASLESVGLSEYFGGVAAKPSNKNR